MKKDQDQPIRPEILELESNTEKTMIVNSVETKKGTVARLAHCINYLESSEDLTPEEHALIDKAIDECLEAFYQMNWHLYYDFKQPYIQKKYDAIQKKYNDTD